MGLYAKRTVPLHIQNEKEKPFHNSCWQRRNKKERKSQKDKVRTSDRRCYKIELFIKEEALRRGSPGFIMCMYFPSRSTFF